MSEDTGRRIYYLAAIAIIAMVVVSTMAVTRPLSIQTSSSQTVGKTLQVTGTGTANSAPDEAILLLAVQTQATSAKQATSDNAAIMSKVFDALASAGVGKDSIETVSFSLTPIYESKQDQTTPPKVLGYTVRNSIQVTVTDFSSVGTLLDIVIAAGVNEVQGVTFTLSSDALATVEKQALQLAVRDADVQAKAVASSLGVSLVGPLTVSPGYIFQPRFETMTPSSATPIQPSTLQVTATVQVTYQFS